MATQTKTRAASAKAGAANLQDAAAAALTDIENAKAEAVKKVDAHITNVAIAGMFGDRDHSDGCPVQLGEMTADRVEADAVTVGSSPGRELRAKRVQEGDTVVVLHCRQCGFLRHFTGYSSRQEFVTDALRRLAGQETDVEDDDLDSSL